MSTAGDLQIGSLVGKNMLSFYSEKSENGLKN